MKSSPPHLGSPYAWQSPHPLPQYRTTNRYQLENTKTLFRNISMEVEKQSRLYLTIFTRSMPYLVQKHWPLQPNTTTDVYKQYDCKRCSPWSGMQSLPRRSLPLNPPTHSQYMVKCNALPPIKRAAFPAPIFTRPTHEQRHYMQISYNEFHINSNIYVESAVRNLFTPKRKVWLSLCADLQENHQNWLHFCGHLLKQILLKSVNNV
jgi:hypothetical protein